MMLPVAAPPLPTPIKRGLTIFPQVVGSMILWRVSGRWPVPITLNHPRKTMATLLHNLPETMQLLNQPDLRQLPLPPCLLKLLNPQQPHPKPIRIRKLPQKLLLRLLARMRKRLGLEKRLTGKSGKPHARKNAKHTKNKSMKKKHSYKTSQAGSKSSKQKQSSHRKMRPRAKRK